MRDATALSITRRATLSAPLLLLLRHAHAADWPDRPVTVVVPFGPGSPADVLARLLAPRLGAAWGQPVVVQNLPGASSTIGVDHVAKAPPDGHTLVLSGDGGVVVRPSMDPPVAYDPVRDLAAVSLLARTRNILVVHPSVPAGNLAELVALARARPGALSYGHTGIGFSIHLGMEMLKQRAGGLDITAVPYANEGPLALDLLQGRISMRLGSGPAVLARVLAGDLRAIAVTSRDRVPALPQVPTVAESGYPGFEAAAWFGVLAPARTPPAVIARLHRGLMDAMQAPEVGGKLEDLALVPVGSTPAEFAALIPREIVRMAAVLEELGLKRR